jgi:Arc/MetJ family transcription regulator
VYAGVVSRTNIDIDDELIARAMRIYGLRTKKEAVDLALRRLVGGVSTNPHRGMLELRGIGWEGDLDRMRGSKIDVDQQ